MLSIRKRASDRKADPKIYMGSADLMRRNLLHRVEVVTLVEDERIRCEIQDMLDACLVDGVLAWELGADGRYHRTPEARAIGGETLEPRSGERENSCQSPRQKVYTRV